MPIEYQASQATFRALVSVEEAEGLLDWVQDKPDAKIDLAACTHLHPANIQVLMAARCHITAWPADTDLHSWLESALTHE